MMKIEIVEINTPPSLQFWSGAQESSFVAFYDGIVSNTVIFLPGVVDMKTSGARNKAELVEKESPQVAFYQGSATRAPAILPGIRQHLKPQPLRHVQLVGFKSTSPHITYLCNEEILSMARTLVLDYKDFLEGQLSSLLNLTLLKREQSLSTSYNQAMLATLDPGEAESQVTPPSNSRYLTGLKKGLPFVAFYDGIAATAVIFLPGAVEQINTSTPGNRVAPFVAFYDGMVASAQIFLPGAVEQAYALTSSHRNKVGLMRHPDVALYKGNRAPAPAPMSGNVQHLKPQPLRHLQLVGFINMESPHITYNEEIFSMVRTLVLDYKDFLADQLSSLLNLALLKREQSLSAAYNQAMLATLDPGEVESHVTPPSNSRYLTGLKKGLPFVAFYDGIAATAVIFLPGAVEQINTSIPTNRVGPFVAFYDGMVATAQIFSPGAVEQAYALTSSHGNKVGLMRHPDVALYKGIRAPAPAPMSDNVQHLKPQPLRHVQLVGFINMESPHITYNEEILSMVRTLVLDYKDFLEGQPSSLLNLALLKREQSLSTSYNQAMLAALDPGEAESQVTPPSTSRYLARLPFIAFYDGVAATAVVFLPGHLKTMESAPSTPRYATRMETGPSNDNVYNYGILTKARVFLPFHQKDRPPEVEPSNPRPLVRPQWSRVEKYRLLKDKLDGLPLRYKPRSTKYITFKEKEMDTRRRMLNTIPSLKPVPPGSCLARSPLTPWYCLEDTHPEMVSATLKDLASQHMKYFRASPSRAPGQQAGRSQIQIMEDLYWEKLRTRGAPGTTEEMYSRLRQEMSFTRKLWFDQKGKSLFNCKIAQLNDSACLNTNNNGYTKEEGDCDLDAANSSVFGTKSDQAFSGGQDLARKKPRHSYLNKRHSDGYRSRNRGPTDAGGAYGKTCIESEQTQNDTVEDTDQVTDSTLQQCHSRDAKLAQREGDKTFSLIKKDPVLVQMSSAANGVSTSGADRNQFFEEDLLQKDTFEEDAEHLKELFKDISHFHSLRNVPESLIEKVVQLTCTPFLKGGYSSGLCFLSSLRESPEYCAGQPIQNLEQCMGQCRSKGRTAVGHTDSSTEREEDSTIQMQRDLWYREECCMRLEQFPVSEDNPTNEDDFMGDLSFTDNCPDDRAESSHSVLHDDFSHEDDILDIPTLSILSTPRASLGQAFHNNHDVSSPALSTPDHVEAKPASHEPFPSEYVFKRVCGPSFSMSSEFWHIKIPTLPSHMVDYKVEPDGLTEIVIGSGSFGEVYAATLTVSPGQSRDVVVKQHFTDRTTQEAIANEAKITMYLESTGCVPICYGLLSDEEEGYNIVMEYVGSGQTLRDVMCESDMPRLHWLNIACQLVNGLKKIHKKEVLINDIKSDNILVDISGELPSVKFCDMGTASYKSGVTYRGDMENCFHLAPEACAHAKTTPACDVYSLGRVLKKIHGASHISALLSLSDMCMAENPAVRPTLLTINQRLQEEYINEALFPTLTVPSHGYLDSIHEEPEEESAGSVLKVNTPIDKDLPTATGLSSAEVNGAVSRDGPPSRGSNRSNRIGQHELGTSVAEAYPDEIQDIYSISIDHVPRIHVSVSSEGHTIPRVNMPNDILYSAEITDTSAGAAKSAQNETPVTNTNAATSKSAQDGSRTLVNNMNTSSSKSTRNGNGSLDAIPAVGTCEVSASFNSPNGSYEFHTQTVPTSPPPVTTPTPASPCASCHFHTTSASLELFSAVVSPKVSSARETPDAASSELQTSSSHSLDTSSDTFVDAAKDQSDADANSEGRRSDADANSEGRRSDADVNEAAVVPAVAAVDVNETSSSLEAPHVAAYRALCQDELEVYNKHWEDTPVYEGYLPLVMSLLMLILGILGFI